MSVRPKTVQLPENTRYNLLDIDLGNHSPQFDTKSKGNKRENKPVGPHPTKSFGTAKEAKRKGSLRNCANVTSDRG